MSDASFQWLLLMIIVSPLLEFFKLVSSVANLSGVTSCRGTANDNPWEDMGGNSS